MTDTIPALFNRQAVQFGRRPIFLVKRGGAYAPISWEQAAGDIRSLALAFLEGEVRVGDRIILLSENRPEWAMADVAIQSVGAWTVPIYHTLTAREIAGLCRDCQPVMGIGSSVEQGEKLRQAFQEAGVAPRIVVMDAQDSPAGLLSWQASLAQGRAAEGRLGSLLTQRLAGLRPEDTATLIYTSGTTGEPKGVMLSHRNFLSNIEACRQVIPFSATDVHLSFLPLSHVFERMGGWYYLVAVGGTIAYAESMESVARNMLEVQPTVMLGVPRFFEKLYAAVQDGLQQLHGPKRRLATWALGVARAVAACEREGRRPSAMLRMQHLAADRLVYRKLRTKLGGRLRFFVSGSAPLSKEIGEFFHSVGVTILEGYGLTETSPVISANPPAGPRFGSVGRPIPGVDVRIAEDGEILTRGLHVMQGYYRKPAETADAITDGWFHTGDIGRFDPDGYLYITDRKKDLIKTAGGKFVAPQKLENLFVTDPYISQAFVYGDREPYCVALIVPKADALRTYAREHGIPHDTMAALVADPRIQAFYWERVQLRQGDLPGFEQVKKIALLEQEFSQTAGELTPTLKAKRSQIAQRYAAHLRRLYDAPRG